jgi:hypothetical protein
VSQAAADGLLRGAVPGPAAVLGIGILAAAAAVGVMYIDWPFPKDDKSFTTTGQFLLWVSILAAQAALWAVLSFPVAASLRVLWRFGENNWAHITAATCAIGAGWLFIMLASLFARSKYVHVELHFPHWNAKVAVFTVFGGAVATASALGMVLVWSGLTGLADKVEKRTAAEASIGDLLLLREHLQRLLTIEGAIIGAAVLSYAGLRNAVLGETPKKSFPPELLLIYGGAFSIALALVWAPIYALFVSVGGGLCDSVIAERGTGESWTEWHTRRTTAADAIGIRMSFTESFRSAVAILTPLGSALLALLGLKS